MANYAKCYGILGLSDLASEDEIKKAYRTLAKQFHPDLNPGADPSKFREIAAAYNELMSSHAASATSGGATGATSAQARDPQTKYRYAGWGNKTDEGQDVFVAHEITFEEAIFGTTLRIMIESLEICHDCTGTGGVPGTKIEFCPECYGSGSFRPRPTIVGEGLGERVLCPKCKGSGKIIHVPCPSCESRGLTRREREVAVYVPAGVSDGQVLTVKNKGGFSRVGGMRGQLCVTLVVAPHSVFRRQGADLIMDMPISFAKAILGGEIVIPTVDGRVKYQLPTSLQHGTIIRLKDKGAMSLDTKQRGDLYIHVQLEIPSDLSKRQIVLLQQFEKESNMKQYAGISNLFAKMKNFGAKK